MHLEEVLTTQELLPFPSYAVRSRSDAADELLKSCGRFRSPLSLMERLRILFVKEVSRFDMLSNVTSVLGPGVPLNWQLLLRYLHRNSVIDRPSFTFTHRANDLPKPYGVELRAVAQNERTDGRPVEQHAYASSFDIETAMGKAVGEMLERYFLTLYKRDTFTHASHAHLTARNIRSLDVSELNAFLPWQWDRHPRFKRDRDSAFYWVRGETLEKNYTYIPAQLVFWNYDFEQDGTEPMLAQPITSGAAGHFTKEEAVLSGLLELIERDGFLVHWLNHLSPRVIDTSDMRDDTVRQFLDELQQYGVTVYFLDTSTDVGVPSVTCALIDERGAEPALVVSGASGFDVRETILKSAHEALNILQLDNLRKDFSLENDYRPFIGERIGHKERIALWKGKEMVRRFSFFLNGERESVRDFLRDSPASLPPPARLEYVASKLKVLGPGYDVFFYEATHPVLKTLGYHVVRTIVPQLMPLYLNEHFATLDSRRLREVPAKLGAEAAGTLNPWPHPFP